MSDATREAEIAKEQHHVDRVYARVEDLRAEAAQAHRQGHQMAHARTPGSLVERDAMVFHTARRLRALDAEYEGLVFGRLDLTMLSAIDFFHPNASGQNALADLTYPGTFTW